MKKMSCFGKLFLVATVCAVSRVGHADREKIKISNEAVMKVMSEVKDFLNSLRKGRWEFNSFYEKNPRLCVGDYDTLCRLLTKDLPEYLTWGADACVDFSYFEKRKFGGTQKSDKGQFVRNFLSYSFNSFIPRNQRRACYGLHLFNRAAADRGPLQGVFFFGTSGQLDLDRVPGLKPFCERVAELLWAEVSRWFGETDPDSVRFGEEAYLDTLTDLGMPEKVCDKAAKALKFHGEKSGVRFEGSAGEVYPFEKDGKCIWVKPCFELKKEEELLAEKPDGVLFVRDETKRQILSEIKAFRKERSVFISKILLCENELVTLLPTFKADCAVLFRFFTQKAIADFFDLRSFSKKSLTEKRLFIKEKKGKKRFLEYLTEHAKKTFGFLKKQCFKKGADRKFDCCAEVVTDYGFGLHFMNFAVREETLFGGSSRLCRRHRNGTVEPDFCGMFPLSFFEEITDLLYPEVESHLDKLSAEIEQDAKE